MAISTFTKKAIDTTNASAAQLRSQVSPKADRLSSLGVAGDKLVESLPGFIESACEKIVQNQSGASIVLGRDRPASRLSGYGGKGDTGAAAIDIVVGRLGSETAAANEEGELIFADPNFVKDAARIYISQKTDIDDNFGLVSGRIGNPKAKSGIALKADNVRLIGREGIKLITRSDMKNSQGGESKSVSGIDLIAGNNDADLQPIVKGDNLVEALKKLTEHVDALSGIVDGFLTYQHSFNSAVMNHTHTLTGTAAGAHGPYPVTGVANPSAAATSAGAITIPACASKIKLSLANFKSNLVMYKSNFYLPGGAEYINSRFNNTN